MCKGEIPISKSIQVTNRISQAAMFQDYGCSGRTIKTKKI
jgi:hypothetical protein